MPLVNAALAICTLWVVLAFGSSARLAAAYGVAVTGTMVVTSIAFFEVTRLQWHWSRLRAGLLCGIFVVVEAAFLLANLHKFADGGWLPIAIAIGLLAIMHTWKSGRTEIQEKVYSGAINELELPYIARSKLIVRVPGSAVFMAASPRGVPLALLHHLKSNKCLQQTVVLLTISFEEIPQVPPEERLILTNEGEGVWRAVCYYGYMESPDVGGPVRRTAGAWRAAQTAGSHLLFQPRDDHHRRQRPHVGMAEVLLRVSQPQCPPGEGLLQGPAHAGDRDRPAGAALARMSHASLRRKATVCSRRTVAVLTSRTSGPMTKPPKT